MDANFFYFGWLSILTCGLLVWLHTSLQKIESSVPARETDRLEPNVVWDLAFLILVSGIVGGRLLHVGWEAPGIYAADPLRVLFFWEGGFVFFGGAILAGLTSWYYLWRKKLNFGSYADFFVPFIAVGYALGRWACVGAGCCYGRTCSLPWAVGGLHPTAIYASIWEIGLLLTWFGLRRTEWALRRWNQPGDLFAVYCIGHGLGRILMEVFRDDFRGNQIFGVSLGTVISCLLIASALVWLTLRKKTGLVVVNQARS